MIELTEGVQIISSILGAIVATLSISGFVFYTKSQVDNKFTEMTTDIYTTRDNVIEDFRKQVKSLEDKMSDLMKALYESKQDDKNLSIELIKVTDAMKDELRKDYISRYNTLLQLVNGKADQKDFNRLEQKFDRVSETITELKTIIELKVKDKKE